MLERHLKELYYSQDKKTDQGICEECRKKHIYNNPMRMLQIYLLIKTQMLCIKHDLLEKGDKKDAKNYKKAIERIEKKEKELEKLPEVQKQYRKNNPAAYKKPIKDKCKYCGENIGQIWINNPNGDWNKNNCWWICKICDKLIKKQRQLSQLDFLKDTIKNTNGDTTKIDEDMKKIQKEIDDIAYEDGQEVFSMKITKNTKVEK